MGWRAENDQFVVEPGLEKQIGIARLTFDQAKIQLKAAQAVDHLLRIADTEVDPAAGILLQVIDDNQRRQIIADGQRGADGHRRQAPASQVALDLAGAGQHVLGLGQQTATTAIEAQGLAYAVEQRAIEMPLQFEQRRAGGRLRHVQFHRRARDVFQTGDGSKDFNLAQSDFHICILDYRYVNYPLLSINDAAYDLSHSVSGRENA